METILYVIPAEDPNADPLLEMTKTEPHVSFLSHPGAIPAFAVKTDSAVYDAWVGDSEVAIVEINGDRYTSGDLLSLLRRGEMTANVLNADAATLVGVGNA